ncbi:MAG: AAA family ATPase [Chloroflexi bacterium]|nr:AAA family ATPase [Chloroflexota bacterium]
MSLRALSWTEIQAEPAAPPPTLRAGIPKVGLTVVAGSPKVGKTLWAGQTALETSAKTLLVIEEGTMAGIGYRLRMQAAALGIVDPPIVVMHRQRVRLDTPASVKQLRDYVEIAKGRGLGLIVLDPLNRLHGVDENRPTEMTRVMDAMAGLAYDYSLAVLAIHHLAKPSAERRGDVWDRFRGASSIRSGTDANLVLDGTGDRIHLVGEFRDAEPLTEWLELDRDALIFRPADSPDGPATKVDVGRLRAFVEDRRMVVARQVCEEFGVSKHTAINALRGLGCDEFAGLRGAITFTLGATVQ